MTDCQRQIDHRYNLQNEKQSHNSKIYANQIVIKRRALAMIVLNSS